MVQPFPRYMVFTTTATADTAFNLTTIDIWFKELDIFVTTNDAYAGDLNNQVLAVYANDVYTIRGLINIREIYFKNYTAGSNTVVSAAGVALSDQEKKEAGLPV